MKSVNIFFVSITKQFSGNFRQILFPLPIIKLFSNFIAQGNMVATIYVTLLKGLKFRCMERRLFIAQLGDQLDFERKM